MLLSLGAANPFPLTLGGGVSAVSAEHGALLRALTRVFDTSEGSDIWVETYADAVAIATIWAVNARLRSMHVPTHMLDALVTWETACGLRPARGDSDASRREAVGAKLRGLSGNALGDIEAAAEELLGVFFVALVVVDPANVIAYWPGINPGPPGLEWSSNRAIVGVRMSRQGLDDPTFFALRARLSRMLDALLPSWMRYAIGLGSSFVIGQGVIGATFL